MHESQFFISFEKSLSAQPITIVREVGFRSATRSSACQKVRGKICANSQEKLDTSDAAARSFPAR